MRGLAFASVLGSCFASARANVETPVKRLPDEHRRKVKVEAPPDDEMLSTVVPVMATGDSYLQSWKEKYPDGKNVGIGIVGSTNGESVFVNNTLRAAKGFQQKIVADGKKLLSFLEKFTSENTCIPKIIFAGHGWTEDAKDGGSGQSRVL